MNFYVILVLFFFIAQVVFAAPEGATRTTTRTERGFVSIGVNAGMSESRALNPNGQWAGYNGSLYGGELELRLWGEGSGEIRLLGRSQFAFEKSRENNSNSVNSTTSLLALKVFASDAFYVGAGTMNGVQKFSTTSNEFSLTNSGMAMGAGYEISLGGNFFGAFNVWYQANPLKNQSPLSGNSFTEGGFAFFSVSWSPPLTIINSTTSSR